jgi:hypothetical protein
VFNVSRRSWPLPPNPTMRALSAAPLKGEGVRPTEDATRVSRLIVKLRGHGLVASPRARLCRVTAYGQRVMTAAIATHGDRYPTNFLAPAA